MFPASRALFALTLLAALPFGAQAETGGQNPSFNLVNRASQPIRELYVTPAGDTNWGQNRLVNGPLPAGDTFAVRLRVADKCVFDMRIVYADAAKEERREVNTCATSDIVVRGVSATGKADQPSQAGHRRTRRNAHRPAACGQSARHRTPGTGGDDQPASGARQGLQFRAARRPGRQIRQDAHAGSVQSQ